MIDYPEREHWFSPGADSAQLAEMSAHAYVAAERTGHRQVIHAHGADQPCADDCKIIEPVSR